VQRKLNRDGAYFVIDTAWRRARKSFAPRALQSRSRFAPLPERPETPSDLKNQKLAARSESGFCGKDSEPNLKNVRPEDIRKPSRLRALFEEATRAGLLERTEAGLLNFAAAAVRANRVSGDAVRVFMGIVRKGLWHHISASDEEGARAVMRGSGRLPKTRVGSSSRESSGGSERTSDAGAGDVTAIHTLIENVLATKGVPEIAAAILEE
jgi:hypothetical protein